MRFTVVAAMIAASVSPVTVRAAEAPAGALSCSGCHPGSAGVDTPVTRIVGWPAADIEAAMRAYKSGARDGTIMERVAKGFADDEIAAIASWYAAQPK
jgi:cytochrome subunit of sulfide dehydrogenase